MQVNEVSGKVSGERPPARHKNQPETHKADTRQAHVRRCSLFKASEGISEGLHLFFSSFCWIGKPSSVAGSQLRSICKEYSSAAGVYYIVLSKSKSFRFGSEMKTPDRIGKVS